LRFGLDIAQHHLGWDEIVERARFAEEAEFEGAWVFDHFKPLYADRRGPCFEAWTLLAGLAVATERIRLGTLVTGITYRHPSILATEVVTVDHLSRGRVECAVGAAWFVQEHTELGIDFPPTPERARRLEEGVQVIKLLMTEDDASFAGRHYRLDGATYGPRPVQSPHPPIWIGAAGERLMLPVVARRADCWHCNGPLEALERKSRIVDEHATRAGRNPSSILRATGLSLSQSWDGVRARIEGAAGGGFAYLTVGWPSEGRGRLEEFVTRVMPDYAGA
jgi:alkanesulfonate monooxygenase SsuD/methylene tetrahydromethanopterin reductase-like flavin-dependent oxidoreductase (luciferase family)